jgi:drug/metabolite transporter (DMT)-like permease
MHSNNYHNKSISGTLSGITAILFWSITAPVIASATGVDPFLYTSLSSAIGFCLFFLRWVALKENPLPELKKTPFWFLLAGLFGISVHELTWVAALQQAPPLEATLIIYTWPFLVVLFTTFALGQKFRWYHIAAGGLGLLGMTALLTGRGLALDHFTILPGHGWAVICALSWSIFSALSARHHQLSTNLLSMIFLASAVINLGIWYIGLGAPPAPAKSLLIVSISSIFIASAYALWDFGMKRGNTQMIGIVSFLTPVLSSLYLVLLDKAVLTPYILLSLFLVMCAIGTARYGEKLDKHMVKTQDART